MKIDQTATHGHMMQLDALRCFAVAFVIVAHISDWWENISFLGVLGDFGVHLFFVLSGFLITGILLDAKSHGVSFKDKVFLIRQFYIRRFLRIFPIYYALNIIICIVVWNKAKTGMLWHLFYMSNFYVFFNDYWPGSFSHYWSLAMEEQFYLLWPLCIFFCNKRIIETILYSLLIVGISTRLLLHGMGFSVTQIYVFPLCNIDSLALGGLVAFLIRERLSGLELKIIASPYNTCISLAVVILLTSLCEINSPYYVIIGKSFLIFAFASLVLRASKGYNGIAGKILSLKPIVYLGIISYGVYLYHNFSLAIGLKTGKIVSSSNNMFLSAACAISLTLFISILSYHFFEKPINSLKKKFPYRVR